MSQNPHDRSIIQPYLGFDCTHLSPTEAYRLLNHLVAPRPIAFVSTISADGIPNLAPFSFFMAGGLNPPSVAFSPLTNRHGQPKPVFFPTSIIYLIDAPKSLVMPSPITQLCNYYCVAVVAVEILFIATRNW